MNKSLEQYMSDGSKLPYRFMKYRIHKILLVCCSYDGYILEEDGHIESQINREYLELNMSNPPSFTRVSSTAEALELLREAAVAHEVIAVEVSLVYRQEIGCHQNDDPQAGEGGIFQPWPFH